MPKFMDEDEGGQAPQKSQHFYPKIEDRIQRKY
jgi:hypothetical protein